jgi:hypothetical protein
MIASFELKKLTNSCHRLIEAPSVDIVPSTLDGDVGRQEILLNNPGPALVCSFDQLCQGGF